MSPVIKILQPSGILNGVGANQVRREVSEMIENGADIILIDLKDVSFMDSSGLGTLVITLRAVRSAGKKLFICSISQQVNMLFELTNMNRIFEFFTNQEHFNQVISQSQGEALDP